MYVVDLVLDKLDRSRNTKLSILTQKVSRTIKMDSRVENRKKKWRVNMSNQKKKKAQEEPTTQGKATLGSLSMNFPKHLLHNSQFSVP